MKATEEQFRDYWNAPKNKEKSISELCISFINDNSFSTTKEECMHDYDIYTNEHGEHVSVCDKCMNSYF